MRFAAHHGNPKTLARSYAYTHSEVAYAAPEG